MNRVDSITLRRRRLVGLGAVALLVLLSFRLNGWGLNPIWTLLETNEGTFTAGDPYDEWIYAVCDGKQQLIAVLRNGQLEGAAALGSLRRTRFPNWCNLPTVNHPNLGEWQAQLAQLRALTASTASAAEILEAARQMPISVLYLQPLSQWIRANAANAAGFLDSVARRPMLFDDPNPAIVRARRDNFTQLIHEALDVAASAGVAPEKAEVWLTAKPIGDGRALPRLAKVDGISLEAMAAILERLETVPPAERGELYMRLAPRLVAHGDYAALLGKQLVLVPSHGRLAAVRALLGQKDASPQFAIALIADFDHKFRSAEAELEAFKAIADKLKAEPEAPLLMTTHLRDLPDMQRRMAATYLLGLDTTDQTEFAMGVLRAFADLHPVSRPKVVYAVMQSPQFRQRAVQEACRLAVQLQTRGPERQELLAAMWSHPDLDSDLRLKIGAELGPQGGI